MMKLYEVADRNQPLLDALLDIWERSVRAAHLFLSDAEVKSIRAYVPQALKSVEHLIVTETEQPIAFMGVQNGHLEMLFLAPEERGKGIGKRLLQYGIENYGIIELTVNEQNPQAVGLYEHMGFETYKRTALDEEGDPYPLLYMKRVREIGVYGDMRCVAANGVRIKKTSGYCISHLIGLSIWRTDRIMLADVFWC